jgi:sulfite exporter TauE/SafE
MIFTIGSLVQETSDRPRWKLATGLYVAAATTTSAALGAALAALGVGVRAVLCWGGQCGAAPNGALSGAQALVGVCAIAYAASDLGFIALPRPVIMQAVPVTWWRRWLPYKAALAYGAALGLGVTTRIPFGAFYVILLSAAAQGNVVHGAVLVGAYGFARAVVLPVISWMLSAGSNVAGNACAIEGQGAAILKQRAWVQQLLATLLAVFGAVSLATAALR